MSSADHWQLLWDRGEGDFFLQMQAIHSFRSAKAWQNTSLSIAVSGSLNRW